MEYYLAIKNNTFESVLMKWMELEPIIQSEVSQKEKHQYLTVWITINCGKFWERWEYQTTWPASWEICMQVRKQQLELDMEQQTGSK